MAGSLLHGSVGARKVKRKLLLIVLAALASGLLAPSAVGQTEVEPIPPSSIDGAEALSGLEFTPAERTMMQEGLRGTASVFKPCGHSTSLMTPSRR